MSKDNSSLATWGSQERIEQHRWPVYWYEHKSSANKATAELRASSARLREEEGYAIQQRLSSKQSVS